MSLVVIPQAQDGVTGVNAASVNNPINTLANDYNGNITDANIAAGAAIAFSKVSGGTSTALIAWQSYTPTWTNVTIGNAVVVAKYFQIGKFVTVRVSAIWGSTTSASGAIVFSLPITSVAYPGTVNVGYIGQGTMFDVSAGAVYESAAAYASTTTVSAVVKTASSSFVQPSTASSTSPVTWAVSDEWAWTLVYEAA